MRQRRGWRARTWAMLWAVLQFALPAAAGAADARLERDSRIEAAHVESASTPACRKAHAAECALCQLLTQHARPAAHAPLPVVVATVTAPMALRRVGPAPGDAAQLPPARAPPLG